MRDFQSEAADVVILAVIIIPMLIVSAGSRPSKLDQRDLNITWGVGLCRRF